MKPAGQDRRPTRRGLRGDSGATAVEFALVLPALVILIFGIFETGRVLYTQNAIEHLADRAARIVMIGGNDPSVNSAQLQASIETQAHDHSPGINPDRVSVSVIPDSTGYQVTIGYDYHFTVPLIVIDDFRIESNRWVAVP